MAQMAAVCEETTGQWFSVSLTTERQQDQPSCSQLWKTLLNETNFANLSKHFWNYNAINYLKVIIDFWNDYFEKF